MEGVGMTDEELAKLASILALLEREGIHLIPVHDDGTPETVQ
jgi:hypothetical protein